MIRITFARCSLLAALAGTVLAGSVRASAGIFIRASLLSPADTPWQVHLVIQRPGGKSQNLFVGQSVAESAKVAGTRAGGEPGLWVELPDGPKNNAATLRFVFGADPSVPRAPAPANVRAKIDVATAAEESAILRSITEHDPGNVIAIRIPSDPANHKDGLLSIREDTQRRLDQVKALNLPDGPRPNRLWCMTGFRANGEFYTDPAITRMDFEIIRRLGMNGFWQQNGGQPGDLRRMAHDNGMDRSTVYWRSVEALPADKKLNGATDLSWNELDEYLDKSYRKSIAATRQQHLDGMPQVIADLADEPDGLKFDGPGYAAAFRDYTREHAMTPRDFGKEKWDEVSPVILRWRQFFARRAELNLNDEPTRKLFYWSTKFWNHCTARTYAMATDKVERYAPGTLTRVNLGPPWWYDYGTLPRGTDAFELCRLRGITMGFNEDWVGKGSPRVPLEIDTLLMDWSRAAARPNTPMLGAYITRDADRASVKLRTFACLAREAKIFDFYYYGPAYTFFDHWSDNASMVQGVGELTRDLGAADDLLYEGRAPKAEVALLYSQSWPVWKTDDTEQCEFEMAYLALLHAGIPVDIVSDTEVADGRFAARRYKCLYVVNESIPAAAAEAIKKWVEHGGNLWASGWAGMRDEYNTPTTAWNDLLGVKSRSWKPTGDLKRLGQPIEPADWKRPIFGRDVTLNPVRPPPRGTTRPTGRDADEWDYGSGRAYVIAWTAGKEYMDAATERDGSLGHAVLFPSDAKRTIFSAPSGLRLLQPNATTSVNQVLAWPLWSQRGGVILLANYTGEPVGNLTITFTAPRPFAHVRSLRLGELAPTLSRQDTISLPKLNDVTDILILD
jgi:hypothetical protein